MSAAAAPRLPADTALARLRGAQAVAVVRARGRAEAVDIAVALAEGGLQAIELTFTAPGAADAIAEARRLLPPELLLGAGTITESEQVAAATAAGADFLVSPHLDPALLEAMLASGRLALPGVLTPSEVAAALRAGATAVKLFPAAGVGIAYMQALFGPFPGLQIVPTGGIGIDAARGWLDAGAVAVGLGGELIPSELRDARAWDAVARNAALLLERLRSTAT
jgi:2-dehydro-3-deoxyphosphogluconate aldolase / (4S)-4-hydroxy-2-oxoglutarate aldolase